MIQAEGLKNKAAKAAEFALDLKKENDATMKSAPHLKTLDNNVISSSGGNS